jgi:biotin transporter BioY
MNTFKLIIGYLIGFSLSVVLIPYLLVHTAHNPDLWLNGTFNSINVNSFQDVLVLLLLIPFFVFFLKFTEYKSKVPMLVPFTKIKRKK